MSAMKLIQTGSISLSLLCAGGIAALSLFDIPELKSQPGSGSLPSIRWLFSRGSHIFPAAFTTSGAGFAYLAYASLPTAGRFVLRLFRLGSNGVKVNGYLAAAALVLSAAPFTSLAMIPANFALIKANEEKGGSRSERAARAVAARGTYRPGQRSAEDSVNGKGEGLSQFADLSGPQGQTPIQTSRDEDEEVVALLDRFGKLNMVRAVLIGAGGILGLWTALL
ncbi:hypothetical protein F4778DRAFT_714796 [Xylariomycetidae sp. FL2044]|nr:hypothetical protein F4778DRAFT_714796 [Xylariomycetidae sp. FL2044]